MKNRIKIAELFILSLPVPPLIWRIEGSTKRGDFRPDSDIDIFALWDHDFDIPLPPANSDFCFYFKGYLIDLWSFAKDWEIFKLRPDLLESIS